MPGSWAVLGAASSAAAMTRGTEQAPAALRRAGLLPLLRRHDPGADDGGDVAVSRWQPDPGTRAAHNLDEVVRVARLVAASVEQVVRAGRRPFVLGGDCTVTVGVVAGVCAAGSSPALLYVDGGPDLHTPGSDSGAHLDSTGVAHLLALPGTDPALAGVGGRAPLLAPAQLVCFGDSLLSDDDLEARALAALDIARVTADDVHADRGAATARALEAVEQGGEVFVLHVDVDVLDFTRAPLADVPNAEGRRVGLTVDELVESVAVFASSASCAAVVLTEVNPDHVPDDALLAQFVELFGSALGGRVGRRP